MPKTDKEFSPLPEEFDRPAAEFVPPAEEGSPGFDAIPRKRRNRLWKLAASAVVAAAIILPTAERTLPPKPEPPAVIVETEPPQTEPPETFPPTQLPTEPEIVPETVPESVPETYPIRDGQVMVTVYNDDPDFDNGFRNRILLQQLMNESELSELELPAPVPMDGYRFLGWSIYYGAYAADYAKEGYIPGTAEFSETVQSPLTLEDIIRIPVYDDGIRYVNIHAGWAPEDGEPLLLLNDGRDNIEGYPIESPLLSAGFVYLGVYPTPVWEGYRFAGWYDADGNRVTTILAEDFYPIIGSGPDDRDWRNPQPITLTARWVAE